MTGEEATLRATALLETHRALGARLIGFGGWEMPVSYSGILEEHRAVRSAAGLFDLSHMGELIAHGPDAADALGRALVTEPGRLAVGRAHYSMCCAEDGGVIDDLIVYRLAADRFLVVPNASNAPVVADVLRERLAGSATTLEDESAATSLVAIQGPAAAAILAPLASIDLAAIRPYGIADGSVAGVPARIARTGYTGEDGFELFVDWDRGPATWDALLDAGRPSGLVPAGLGARDTLRLEAGMPLYGHELDRATTPFEAGLGRFVHLDRPTAFAGRPGIEAYRDAPRRRLVGLRIDDRAIARQGHLVHLPGDPSPCGVVTSGSLSPTLGVPIAMAWVPPDRTEPGGSFEIAVRDRRLPAAIVPLPFYRRPGASRPAVPSRPDPGGG